MEFLFENILNLIGFVVGLGNRSNVIHWFQKYRESNIISIINCIFLNCIGFFVIWMGFMAEDFVIKAGQIERWVQTLGIGIQTIGYFFIAFSHSIKSFFPKSRYFRSVGIFPLFLVSLIHIENILRSVSFILLVYGAIETIMSYLESKKKGAILLRIRFIFTCFGEFLGWYSFVFPESILYYLSISIKIGGLIALFIPVSKIPLTKIKFDEEI